MITTFLTRDDYPSKIDTSLMDQITGGDDTILDAAEAEEVEQVVDRTLIVADGDEAAEEQRDGDRWQHHREEHRGAELRLPAEADVLQPIPHARGGRRIAGAEVDADSHEEEEPARGRRFYPSAL